MYYSDKVEWFEEPPEVISDLLVVDACTRVRY